MLGSMDIAAFVPTRNPQKARPYYEKTPSGAKVAWFRDPDGNVLSVTES
jgi:hypothetical protein